MISKWRISDKTPGLWQETQALASITNTSIVSRETVRKALMIVTFNDLGVKLSNILNAYVQAHITEKMRTISGPEFGKDARKTAVIVRASHGLK